MWATGFQPDYSWLHVPVLDAKGMVRHDGGVAESPGMYLIGTPFLRRRKSSFMDGGRVDAEELTSELQGVSRTGDSAERLKGDAKNAQGASDRGRLGSRSHGDGPERAMSAGDGLIAACIDASASRIREVRFERSSCGLWRVGAGPASDSRR